MRRLLLHIFTLTAITALACGCNRNTIPEPNPGPVIPESVLSVADGLKTIRLGDGMGSFTLRISASQKWHMEYSGTTFTVSPEAGDAGSCELTFTRTSEKSVGKNTSLGSAYICIDGTDMRYDIDVVQLPRSEKTVIAYFFGTSLYYYFYSNIQTMKQSAAKGFPENSRLLLFCQKSLSAAEIKEIYYDSKRKCVCEYTIEEVGISKLTSETFGSHIGAMAKYAPADSYSAIFLGHSTAWLPAAPKQPDTVYSVIKAPSMEKVPGADETRNIGEEKTALDIDELADGLSSVGIKFDCLYFDVCFMSSLEAAYALRNNAEHIIASPCEIMAYGSPYHRILLPLFKGDNDTVCYEFWDFYNNEYGGRKSACIADINTSRLDAVAAAAKRINAMTPADGFDIRAIQSYEGRKDHWFFDAGHYMTTISTDTALADEFTDALAECITCKYNTDSYFSAYNNKMNDIVFFSGISMTPDEKGIAAIDELLNKNSDLSSSERSELSVQKSTLEYYLPSLQNTDWYAATH